MTHPSIEIPKILRDKIRLETPYNASPDVVWADPVRDCIPNEFYREGSVRIKGSRKSKQCYFLTLDWRTYGEGKVRWPVNLPVVTDGIDFAIIVTADSRKEARDKIDKMIQDDRYDWSKKNYTLEPAFEQLKPKKRGVSHSVEKSQKNAVNSARVLYEWLKFEILTKTEGERYPEINTVLKNMGIKKAERKRHNTIKILTYELLKREFPGLSVKMSTFDKHYIHPLVSGEISWFMDILIKGKIWTALANKFLHNGRPELWCLDYHSTDEGTTDGRPICAWVIKKPDADQILRRNPLECSFDVYDRGQWNAMNLRWQKFDNKLHDPERAASRPYYYSWTDVE